MTFTVTYRGADGAPETDVVEAASRADCLAQMRARGMAVLGVKETRSSTTKHTKYAKEDGNGSRAELAEPRRRKDGRDRAGKKPSSVCYFLFAAIAVIAAIALWWWMAGRRGVEVAPQDEGPKKPSAFAKEVKPAAAKPVAPKVEVQTSGTNAKESAVRNVRMEHGAEVVSVQTRTNSVGTVVEKLRLADGRIIENVYPPKPIFNNPSDQLIAMALSFKPGQSMAPLPSLSNINQDFANSLLSPIVINDDDSDDVKEQKLAVKEARAYIVAEIKNGRTVAECLNEYRDQLEKIADRHQMAILEIQKMKANGTPEDDIIAFKKSVNDIFREHGIPELPISKTNTTNKRSTKE